MIELRVLGAFDVHSNRPDGMGGALTQPKRVALLLYLALAEPAGLHARDRLLAMLWPEADDASSRHSLRNALHALRQILGDEAIVTRGEALIGLDFALLHCDALELRQHLAAGRLDQAIALWRGDLAPGFHVSGAPDFEHWLDELRTELRRAVRAAAWTRVRDLKGTGQAELEAARRATQLDPGNEPGARHLMLLLEAAHDRGGALQAYESLADYFTRELGAVPSSATRAIAARLRSPRVSVPVPAPSTDPPDAASPVPSPVRFALPPRPPVGRSRPWMAGALMMVGAVVAIGLGMGGHGVGRVAQASPADPTPASEAATEAERAVLRLPARYRADTSAYSSYLRGLTLRFQFRFPPSRDTFAALVDRAPLYVPGLYGLAEAWIFLTLNDLTDAGESWPKVDALARRALALDSSAAGAWLALASEDMFVRHDLARASERIARARLLDSLEPDAAGMQSVWYRFHGEMDSAITMARVAHRLDPVSVFFGRLVGKQLFFARRYEESRQVFAQMLRDDPGWKRGYSDFGELYRAMGRPRDAVEWFRRAAVAAGDSARAAALPAVSSDSAAVRLLAADARRTIARFDRTRRAGDRVPAADYAVAHAALQDTAGTLRWLDSMLTQNDSYQHQVRLDPVFDFVRSDPRYAAWEAATRLPPLPSAAGRR